MSKLVKIAKSAPGTRKKTVGQLKISVVLGPEDVKDIFKSLRSGNNTTPNIGLLNSEELEKLHRRLAGQKER